jgi:sirohydrochlorin ferrochelatase
MAAAAERHRQGAVIVVGCAPTALDEIIRLLDEPWFTPALVIGVPVGFVGAASAKAALHEAAQRVGVPSITLRGERGGAAVAVAIVNALGRLAGLAELAQPPAPPRSSPVRPGPIRVARGAAAAPVVADVSTGPVHQQPAMVLMGHGTRSGAGEVELRAFAAAVAATRPGVDVATGFIEFMQPDLDGAIEEAVTEGARRIIAVPLVLLGARHLKDDGPAAIARGSARHPDVAFGYAREFGVHPLVLSTIADRITAASGGFPGGVADAVVVVGRGSTDPDANADLAKAARLLADGRTLGTGLQAGLPDGIPTPPLGLVEPAFVSLARPGVAGALDRCAAQGARRIVVVPYFFFTGRLVERIAEETRDWAAAHPGTDVVVGAHMGVDARLITLAWERYDEAAAGQSHMNCDGCIYRSPLPGYEHRVGAAPFTPSLPGPGGTVS